MQSPKFQTVFTIEVRASLYKNLFSSDNKNSRSVLQYFERLSKEIEEDKVLKLSTYVDVDVPLF